MLSIDKSRTIRTKSGRTNFTKMSGSEAASTSGTSAMTGSGSQNANPSLLSYLGTGMGLLGLLGGSGSGSGSSSLGLKHGAVFLV